MKNNKLLIGAHFSISGGIENAIIKAEELNCPVLQIFTKNARQWNVPPLKKENINKFLQKQKETDVIIASHDSYLINLATKDKDKINKSNNLFIEELTRTSLLNIPYLVFHPGIANQATESEAIDLIAHAIDYSIEKSENSNTTLLLETTAGQKNSIGYKFEHIRDIIDKSKYKKRLGVCFDTCHVFAAGYDIKTKKGYENTMKMFDDIIGLNLLNFFHFNDSKGEMNSHMDRHEHIGKGKLGLNTFKFIINDNRFKKIGKCLETPKGNDYEFDKINLDVLRSLFKGHF
ncbi:MAG: deoxyribonuclease IV [Spirochaetes bacterium]|nr:deoxyribonuclease IV [Spirochaetota bacterium]